VSRREQIRMTPDEVLEFLEAQRKLHVATLNPDGSVHLVTVFHIVDAGAVSFWAYTRSQKIRNLERDPRITVMAEDGDGYAELRGLQLRGRAHLTTDPDALLDIGERLYERNFGSLDEGARAGIAWAARKRTRVTAEPLRTASWDHRKLGGAY